MARSCLSVLVGVAATLLICAGGWSSSPSASAAPLARPSSPAPLRGLTCDLCKEVVSLLQKLLLEERTEDFIVAVATQFCIVNKIEDRNVCSLIIPHFKDEVLNVADRVALSPNEACGIILGPSCAPSYNPNNQTWTVPVPGNKPPIKPVLPPKSGSPTNRILHLTDMHFDSAYTPGLTNDCGEPLCCRTPNPPGEGSTAAGYWGDYQCDVPYHTLENMMQSIAAMKDEFDWVYWTGDLPAHNVWNQSREDQLFVINKMCALLHQYIPDKMVFATLGNHESAPVNSFPPPFITGELSNQWLLDAVAEQWGAWLSKLPDWKQANETILKGGFYNVKIRDGLRVISLQTNYANSQSYWLLINATDPAGQLSWLVDQLQEAEASGDKVHIIGHIPPSGFMREFSWTYHKIVTRFESTIIGQFFGHTHKDSFEVFFDDDNKTRATNVAYIGPGVTSYQGINYGFRFYTIDGNYKGSTNAVLDHASYYLNISDANLTNKPKWLLEYTVKDAYNLTSLQPQDWAQLVDKFRTDDKLFQKYYDYHYKMHPPTTPCDAACKTSAICHLKYTRPGSPEPCKQMLPPGVTMTDVEEIWRREKLC